MIKAREFYEKENSKSISLADLSNDEFLQLKDFLQKENNNLVFAFQNPMDAIFYMYNNQKKPKTNDTIQSLILSASGHSGKLHKTGSEKTSIFEIGTKKFGRPMEEKGISIVISLPENMRTDAEKIMDIVSHFQRYEKQLHSKIEKYSPELANAHKREADFLYSEAVFWLRSAALLKDQTIQNEKTAEALVQTEQISKRLKEAQKMRLSMLDKMAKKGEIPKDLDSIGVEKIDININYIADGIDKEKVINETKGYSVYALTNPLSSAYVDSYTLLSKSFNTDELDPSTVVMEFMNEKAAGILEKNPQGTIEYTKGLIFFIVKNPKGQIVGLVDGTFSANKKINEFYMAHIAVLPEYRRNMIATFVESAMITKCDEYALDAQKALKTNYPSGKFGNKLMSVVLETEFPSLRPSEVRDSFGRLIFHGSNGFSVFPPSSMRYRQSDTEWEEGKKYTKEEWKSVPMFFAIRGIGRDISAEDGKELLRLMYNGFVSSEMNLEGVESDWKYAMDSSSNESPIRLPTNQKELELFISLLGNTDIIMKKYYSDSPWAAEYLQRAEKPISVKDAFAIFEKGNKKN